MGRDVDIIETGGDGKADIYLVSLAQDAFHGVSPAGGKIISSKLPDFSGSSEAIVYGFVELIASVALKDTRGAAVIRDVKVKHQQLHYIGSYGYRQVVQQQLSLLTLHYQR